MINEEARAITADPDTLAKNLKLQDLHSELLTYSTIEQKELLRFIDWDSYNDLDKKIAVIEAALSGKPSTEIPDFEAVQTLRPDKVAERGTGI